MTQDAATIRKITGALREAIAAHGPITDEGVGSAAKRVYGALYGKEKPLPTSTVPANRTPLDSLRLPDKAVILRVGDRVRVEPSRPRKQDGFVGTVVQLYKDKGGPVVEVTAPGQAPRSIPLSRIRGRTSR